jgi:hypothetical protein
MMRSKFSTYQVGGIVIVVAVMFTWAHVLLTPPQRLPIRSADGIYFNKCCGSLLLKNGLGTARDHTFYYTIEADKRGPYVLPTSQLVMADTTGLSVSPAKSPLEMPFDGSSVPKWIDIVGPEGAIYRFVRQPS